MFLEEVSMRFSWLFILQLCVGSISSYAGERSPLFHALVIYEKGTAQGLHEEDAGNMEQTFGSIAKAIGRKARITKMKTCRVSMRAIKKWCSKIKSRDIAVLYYSGSNPGDNRYRGQWPLISMGSTHEPFDDVAKKIHSKKAKLSLAFADCYNTTFVATGFTHRIYGSSLRKVQDKHLIKKLKRIWLSEKGTLTMCSNAHGEVSYGMIMNKNSRFGVFTEALLLRMGGIGCSGYNRSRPIWLTRMPNAVHESIVKETGIIPKEQRSIFSSTIVEK
jgi:hypothetical protein